MTGWVGSSMKVDTEIELCAGKKVPKLPYKTYVKNGDEYTEANKQRAAEGYFIGKYFLQR